MQHSSLSVPPAAPRPHASTAEARRGDWMVLFSAVCFATMPVFGSYAYGAGVGILTLLAWRFVLSVALLLLLAALLGRTLRPPRGTALPLLGMGAMYLIMSFIYFQALRLAPVSTLTLLFYTYPAVVTILSAVVLREPLTRVKAAALLLALAGCAVVLSPAELGDWRGPALALAASLLYSGFLVVGTPLIRRVEPVLATILILSVCAAGYLGAALLTGAAAPPPTPAVWGSILGIAVIATVLSDLSFFWGLPRTGASRAAILSTLEPVCTLVMAALLLGEPISAGRLGGGALILLSVILIHRE
jgi:drug/metabolite transporter (DMT)-like permease